VLQGYCRVSTADQNPDAQRDALIRAGVAPDQLYLDHTSGAKSSRPAWDALRKALHPGDVLIATRLDRVGRSTSHLVTLLDELAARGVAFRFLEQGIDTTTSEGRLMYRMLAAIAEFQRDLIIANTREGLAAARARGRTGGRKPKLTTQQVQLAQQLYDAGEKTVAEIAAIFTVPRTTIYGHLINGSTSARPRARKPPAPTTATAQANDAPATPAGGPADALRPRPARIQQTDEPASVRELQLRARLVRQREAMRATRCPSCGNEPVDAQTRWRQRQDLATIWLHLDSDGTLREQRHCVACQPHDQPLIIECDRCGDGPLITGLPATTPPGQWPPAITRWLHNNGWRTDSEPRCGNHH
jgi:DNA invertase Pin-like site-specific DNA recombinase